MAWSLEFFGILGAGDDGLTLHYDDEKTHICFTPWCYFDERAFRTDSCIYRDAHCEISCTNTSVLVCFDGASPGTPRIEFAVPRTSKFDEAICAWKSYAKQRQSFIKP